MLSSASDKAKIIANIFSKNSNFDKAELLYILAEIFNMSLKESCFHFWKVSAVVSVFKNVGERSTAKT